MMRKALRTGPRAAAREKTMSRSEPSRPKMRTTRKARSDRSTCRYAARTSFIITGPFVCSGAEGPQRPQHLPVRECLWSGRVGAAACRCVLPRCETPLQGRLERTVYSLAVPQPSITLMTDSDTLGRRAQASLAVPQRCLPKTRAILWQTRISEPYCTARCRESAAARRHTTRHAHRAARLELAGGGGGGCGATRARARNDSRCGQSQGTV